MARLIPKEFPNVHYSTFCEKDEFNSFLDHNIETVNLFTKVKNENFVEEQKKIKEELKNKEEEALRLQNEIKIRKQKEILMKSTQKIQAFVRKINANRLQKTLLKTQDEKKTLEENNNKLLEHRTNLNKSVGNQQKSVLDEEECRQLLEKKLKLIDGKFSVIDVSKKNHQMDTMVLYKGIDSSELHYRIDWKSHYSKNKVNSIDVNKFEKDTKNLNPRLSFLVAETGIVNKTSSPPSVYFEDTKSYISCPIETSVMLIVTKIFADFQNFKKKEDIVVEEPKDEHGKQLENAHKVFGFQLNYVYSYIKENAKTHFDKCKQFGYFAAPWKLINSDILKLVFGFKDDCIGMVLKEIKSENSPDYILHKLKSSGCEITKKNNNGYKITKDGKTANSLKKAKELFLLQISP